MHVAAGWLWPGWCLDVDRRDLAEREGFEPSIREARIPDFESGAFDHSATFPGTAFGRAGEYSIGARPPVAPGATVTPGRRLRYGSRRSSPPSQGRNARGMAMLPSGCWWFSRTATSVRPTARPEPFNVCTSSGLPLAGR